jgi:hypothetical protein
MVSGTVCFGSNWLNLSADIWLGEVEQFAKYRAANHITLAS